MPSFRTINPAGPRLVYLSYMVFGGKTYSGEVAGSKKMAEQLVARVATRSLLGIFSDFRIIISVPNLCTI